MTGESSQDIVRGMQAAGLSYADIGRAVGRNRSLIRQIAIGAKPGENLRGALADVQQRLALIESRTPKEAARKLAPVSVPRRMSASGREARVRRPVTVSRRSWSTSTLRRQASQGGAGGMLGPVREAARMGRTIAATVTFSSRVYVDNGYGKRGIGGPGGTVDMELGDAGDILERMEAGESFADIAVQAAAERGNFTALDDAALYNDVASSIDAIEMRAY